MNQSSILMIYMSVLLIIILFIRWWLVRRKVAIEKVKERTDEQKLKDINFYLIYDKILFIQVCIRNRESLGIANFMMN